jgi:F0F1-type ATP synthase assembly protein I
MRKTCARLSCRRPPSCPNRHSVAVRATESCLASEPSPTFQRNTRAISLAFSIGFSLAGPVILGALAGYWLDGRFGTSPTWTMILTILGMGAGLAQMIRVVNKLNQLEDKR